MLEGGLTRENSFLYLCLHLSAAVNDEVNDLARLRAGCP